MFIELHRKCVFTSMIMIVIIIIIANSYTRLYNFQLVAPLAEDPIGHGITCSERGQVDALSASENFENFPQEGIRGKNLSCIIMYVCIH